MQADDTVTVEHLADELLAACIIPLGLRGLPLASPVSRRWRDAARMALASQLRWRATAHCASLPLPMPSTPWTQKRQRPCRPRQKDGMR